MIGAQRILTPNLLARVMRVVPLAIAQKRFPASAKASDLVRYAIRERDLNNYLAGRKSGKSISSHRRAVVSLCYVVERLAEPRVTSRDDLAEIIGIKWGPRPTR